LGSQNASARMTYASGALRLSGTTFSCLVGLQLQHFVGSNGPSRSAHIWPS
jgi:hypothetical protein